MGVAMVTSLFLKDMCVTMFTCLCLLFTWVLPWLLAWLPSYMMIPWLVAFCAKYMGVTMVTSLGLHSNMGVTMAINLFA